MALKTEATIYQLIEINRALTHDLDIVRRSVSILGRERDELLVEVEGLRKQTVQNNTGDCLTTMKRDLAEIRKKLQEGHDNVERFREHIERQVSLLYRYYSDGQKKSDGMLDELRYELSAITNALHLLVGSKVDGRRLKERIQ